MYENGHSAAVMNPSSEEVLYVVRGKGQCHVNGFSYDLASDTGVFIPPGTEYSVQNAEAVPLMIVSALCPEDPNRTIKNESSTRVPLGSKPELTVHVGNREKLPATAGREFCFMVDKELGCQQVTQFVGWIPPSAAPFHHHEYEEVIYILAGKGILHVAEESIPFETGSSIYLPVRVPHCLENPGPLAMRVLGVFYPSGSPAAAYH
ncbi:MAG TPA: cupin domain-containing protein [Bryobacteraceae bacterium]|nr:cupin domain-containing protein [Bryobacteraceae bacterium]